MCLICDAIETAETQRMLTCVLALADRSFVLSQIYKGDPCRVLHSKMIPDFSVCFELTRSAVA